MSLRVVLGPAGARKTGLLLDAHQAAAAAGREAWLVAPSGADRTPLQRELLGLTTPGAVPRQPTPYAELLDTLELERRLLRRCTAARALGHSQRLLLAEATIREALAQGQLVALKPAARRGWLAGELVRLVDELTIRGDLVAGEAPMEALERWGRSGAGRRGAELAALLRADAARRAAVAAGPAGLLDRASAIVALREALAATPSTVDGLHLTLAGLDDLDPVQRDLVLALGRSPATVLLSLPFAQGREALAAAGPLVEALIAGGATVEYAEATPELIGVHPVLARLRERLYEASLPGEPAPQTDARGQPVTAPDRPEAPVIELRGGGPQEETTLIAEAVHDALARGIEPARIAVVTASPERHGAALTRALSRAGIPAHLATRARAATSPIVRGVAALLRATGPAGRATDLVAYCALLDPARADLLDAEIRRRGARRVGEALSLWRHPRVGGEHLSELDELGQALQSTADPGAAEQLLAELLSARGVELSSQPVALTPEGARSIRAAQEAAEAMRQRAAVVERAATLSPPVRLPVAREDLERQLLELLLAPEPEPADSVAVLGPLAVRTRALDVLVLAHAQYGTFPAPESARRLLSRTDRAELTGYDWPRPVLPDHAAQERYLAYEIASTPEQQLIVGWHAGDGDGGAEEPSPLVVELRRTAGNELVVRELAAGRGAARGLTGTRAAAMAEAADGPRHLEPAHHQASAAATDPALPHGVRALQTASRCTAQWFVDHHLQPRPLDPDAAPLTAGRLRHEVLAALLRALLEQDQALAPEALPALHERLDAIAAVGAAEAEAAGETLAERLLRERVIAEVRATLHSLVGAATLRHQPSEFELAFGTTPAAAGPEEELADDAPADARPPVVVERGGERLTLSGRIDRLDLSEGGDEVVVVDYKGGTVSQYAGGKWIEQRELQAGLYALVAEQLTGARAVGSLYQPVPAAEGEPARGATVDLLAERRMRPALKDAVGGDAWSQLMDQVVQLAAEAARAIEAGQIAPCPSTCSNGGCRYPWLCREEGA